VDSEIKERDKMDINALYSTKGRIFDVQKFSVHDGPGIRTIIFLKGCLLRCRWCCNPESQKYEVQTMIRNGKQETIGYEATVGELMEIALKDMPYYRRSGGGVTLSGGECLCQPDFTEALLHACKENGLNTAIETTAATDYSVIQRILPYLDVCLMDIKHTNSSKQLEFTNQPNERILENAKRLANDCKELIIRVPTIPTFNDTEQEIYDIAKFTKSLGTVKEMHLLPYHRLGYDKYIGLGREYLMGDVPSPSKEKMEQLKKAAESAGMTVLIGG